jgi:hypothetical protein
MKFSKLIKNIITEKNTQYLAIASIATATMLLPELSFAVDAFADIHAKVTGWIGGTAGKLITFICFAMAGIMGVAGFPTKYILGAMGTGLLLSSSNSLVNMMF